ncbi:MAG: hypothetical protein U0441_17095 [Polyangiaceae bacterium]
MRALFGRRTGIFGMAAVPFICLAACGGNVTIGSGGSAGSAAGGSTGTTTTPAPTIVSKLDVVLDIDNSRSMADKQAILALAVPDLVKRLVDPPCVSDATGEVTYTPTGPLEECPAQSKRAFQPLLDIHLGIITSSLGGHGSDTCSTDGAGKESNNDRGHLIARQDPTTLAQLPTYQSFGFLAWDPKQKLTPPGEMDVDADTGGDADNTALIPSLRDMILGAGQIGCGLESQMEAWYRFLVDPTPYGSLILDASQKVSPQGTDATLLEQRKQFLRPDSALAIIMLTDENDCSIRESGQFYFAAQAATANGSPFHLPKPRAICESDPGNECCFSCGQSGPKDQNGNPLCDQDPSCKTADGKTVYLDEASDNINLRCWEQKRRFGIDFLYPIDRYTSALTSATVTDRNGNVVQNPIFDDLDPTDAVGAGRDAGMVLLAGIVGVPWQDIARVNAAGVPDLNVGLDVDKKPTGGFKSASEMNLVIPGLDYTAWDLVLGDFEHYGAPQDPLMRESVAQRSGKNPITGEALASGGQPLANKINGNEWTIAKSDDLQYACIFPLVKVDDATGTITPAVRDCSDPSVVACDCQGSATADNPLCQMNPATGQSTDQVRAKLYPGLRHLAVLKGLGEQGVVASGCPAQLTTVASGDFGYRPAVASIIERLRPHLAAP